MADTLIYVAASEYDKLVDRIKPQHRFFSPAVQEENILLPMAMLNTEDLVVFVRKAEANG